MSSSQSLIGLVNQLQNMETSFTNILMEAALKLASLTDASLFLLVETPEGRRYAGRPHLCTAYQDGTLNALPDDKEMETDLTVSGLREKARPMRAPESLFPESFTDFSSPVTSSRKRHQLSESILSNAKQPRLTHETAPTQTKMDKMEISALKEEDFELLEEDGGDSDIEEIFAEESSAEDERDFGKESFDLVSNFSIMPYEGTPIKTISQHKSKTKRTSTNLVSFSKQMSLNSADQLQLKSEMSVWLSDDFIPGNKKIAALQEITNISCFLSKESVERKLLSSVCYDLGKQHYWKFYPRIQSVKPLFELFWTSFPNFASFQFVYVPYKPAQNYTFKSMCVDYANKAVASVRYKQKKKDDISIS